MKILVIRLKQVGDALLSLPVCASLKQTYPDAQVDYVVYEHIAPLLRNNPYIDHIVTITPEERARPLQYLRKMFELRRARYDLVIDLITVPPSALMTFVSGARQTIGFDHRKTRSFLYKTKVPHPTSGSTLDAKLSVLSALGDEVRYERSFAVYLDDSEVAAMRARLQHAGVDMSKMLVFASITSRRDYKYWPVEYFAQVLDWFRDRYDAEVIINSMPGREREFVEKTRALLTDHEGVHADIDCDLRGLAALIKNCDFTIANDGGPNHISIAVGTPSLAVFSPINSKYAWIPELGERHQGVDLSDVLGITAQAHRDRMAEFRTDLDRYYRMLTPDRVIARAEQMIERLIEKQLMKKAEAG